MSLTKHIEPAKIEKPRIGDKIGFAFGLISVGKALWKHASARGEAEKTFDNDQLKAFRKLERSERLLFNVSNRTKECEKELIDTLITHSKLLRKAGKPDEAARLLLRCRSLTNLAPFPDSLAFLADSLAKTSEVSDSAVSIYIDYLVAFEKLKGSTVADSVSEILATCVIPKTPLDNPNKKQREILSKIPKTSSIPFVLFAKALCAYHGGQLSESSLLASKVPPTARFGKDAQCLVHIVKAKEALGISDYASAGLEYGAAWKILPDVTEPATGLALVASKYYELDQEADDFPSEEFKRWGRMAIQALTHLLSKPSPDQRLLRKVAQLYSQTGDLSKAVETYKQLVAKTSEPDDVFEYATNLIKVGKAKDALEVASKASRGQSSNVSLRTVIGDAHFASGDWQAASTAYSHALEANKEHAPALIGSARTFIQLGKIDEAINLLSGAKDKTRRDLRFWLGRALLNGNRFDEAATVFEALYEEKDTYDVCYYAASAFALNNQILEALSFASKAESRRNNVESKILIAKLLIKNEQFTEAESYVRQVESMDSTSSEIAYLRVAIAYASGDMDKAEALTTDCLNKAPNDPRYNLASAMVCLRKDLTQPAIEQAKVCLQLDPKSVEAATVLASAYEKAENLKDGENALLSLGLNLDDYNDLALWILGRAAIERGDYDMALDCWQRLAIRVPDLQRLSLNINQLLYRLGQKKLESGDYQAAIDAWRRFGELREDDDSLWQDIGELQFRLGCTCMSGEKDTDLNSHRQDLSEALRLLNGAAKVHFHLALLDLQCHKGASAVQHLLQVVKSEDERYREVAWLWMALAYIQSGSDQEALELLENLKKKNCSDSVKQTATHLLAITYARLGGWDDAAKLAESVISGEKK